MSNGNDYEVKVTTIGDPKGADKVADSLNKVTKAAKENSTESRKLTDDLTSLGARQNATKDVVEGLDSALRGNAASFFGVAKAATNLWEVLTVSTPMGRLVQLGLIAINTFSLVSRHFEEAGKKAADAAPGVDALAEAMKKAGEARSESIAKALTAIKDEAKGAADEMERVLHLKQLIAQATGADDTAGGRERDDLKLGLEFSAALQAKNRTAAQREGIGNDIDAFQRSIDQMADIPRQRAALRIELANLQRQPGGTSPEAMARGERMQEINGLLKGLPDPNSPEAKQFIEQQKERVKRLKADLDKAIADATAADEAFRSIARNVVGIRPDGSAIVDPSVAIARGLQDRKARQDAGLPELQSASDTSHYRTVDPNGTPSRAMVVDGRSMAAASGKTGAEIAAAMAAAGGKTGGEIAAAMAAALEERDAALLAEFKKQLAAMRR